MRRWIPILAALLMTLLWGCGKSYVEADATAASTHTEEETTVVEVTTAPEPETTAEEETLPEPEERVEIDGKIRSYLTGEMIEVEKGNRRPLAIMMSNDKAALPQYGINRAGVVYEAPVEGSMNRYMAILEDYDDLDRIGSVRSCRTYYIYFAKEFNAIYAHFGQSTFAKPYLSEIDNINGIEGAGSNAFYRSSDRKAPHNAYASFEKIQAAIEKLGYSQEYDPEYEGHYLFARDGEEVRPHPDLSIDAFRVVPGYALNQPYFEYNEEDGLYYRYQYGALHEGNEGPIAVKNIFFQYCPIGRYANTEYLNIGLDAPQYGYYITNGRAVPMAWEKKGPFGVTHYYNTENEEITLNQGKTWVCIISAADFDKSEIHGKDD